MKSILIQGTRICDIVEHGKTFPVSESLFWIDAPDDVTNHDTYENGTIVKYVPYVPTTEKLWAELRKERNAKLDETDWTQMPDAPSDGKVVWATYRQALRDLPANTADPTDITWPTWPTIPED